VQGGGTAAARESWGKREGRSQEGGEPEKKKNTNVRNQKGGGDEIGATGAERKKKEKKRNGKKPGRTGKRKLGVVQIVASWGKSSREPFEGGGSLMNRAPRNAKLFRNAKGRGSG